MRKVLFLFLPIVVCILVMARPNVSEAAACPDPQLTEMIKKVVGREPAEAECSPKLYDPNGSWSNAEDLQNKVEFYFGRTKTGKLNAKHPFNQLFYQNLDYGIYWYGKDNQAQKFKPGIANPYYDPNKPTVIYVHGWEKGSVAANFRESGASYDFEGAPKHLFNPWITKGYNVGVFYWNQFADDDHPESILMPITTPVMTESKIWTTGATGELRWRKPDGTYGTVDLSKKSVGELFYDEYVASMANQKNTDIRIVVHSLGHQLAVRLGKMACEKKSAPCPKRLTLLDPYNNAGVRSYPIDGKKQTTVSVVNQYVTELTKKGVAIELYQSSGLMEMPGAENNIKLKQMATYTRLSPDFLKNKYNLADTLAKEHVFARDWYFLSIQYKIPVIKMERINLFWGMFIEYPVVDKSYPSAPSASASHDVIKNLMNINKDSKNRRVFTHYAGTLGYEPWDDNFLAKAF
jgi:hypothetical protein